MGKFLLKLSLFVVFMLLLIVLAVVFLPYNPDGFFREQKVKDEILSDSNRSPSLVLLGGSNVAFGFKSYLIEDSIGINVVNFGLHAGLGLDFILRNCCQYLRKGDLLVICPEYEHFTGSEAYGGLDALGQLTLLDPKQYFKLLNNRQKRMTLKAVPSYLKSIIDYWWDYLYTMGVSGSNYRLSVFNKKGDLCLINEEIKLGEPSAMRDTLFNNRFLDLFFEEIKKMERQGIEVFFYPPSEAESFFALNSEFVEKLDKEFKRHGYSPICEWSDCAYPDTFFYDSKYHLNTKGAIYNSQHFIELMRCINTQ